MLHYNIDDYHDDIIQDATLSMDDEALILIEEAKWLEMETYFYEIMYV